MSRNSHKRTKTFLESKSREEEYSSGMVQPWNEHYCMQDTGWEEYQHPTLTAAHLQLTAISGDKIGGTLTKPHTNEILIKGTRQENRNMASYYLPKQAVTADCSNYTATQQRGFC